MLTIKVDTPHIKHYTENNPKCQDIPDSEWDEAQSRVWEAYQHRRAERLAEISKTQSAETLIKPKAKAVAGRVLQFDSDTTGESVEDSEDEEGGENDEDEEEGEEEDSYGDLKDFIVDDDSEV